MNNNLQRKNFPVSDPLGEVDAHVLVLVGDLQDPLDDDMLTLHRTLQQDKQFLCAVKMQRTMSFTDGQFFAHIFCYFEILTKIFCLIVKSAFLFKAISQHFEQEGKVSESEFTSINSREILSSFKFIFTFIQ